MTMVSWGPPFRGGGELAAAWGSLQVGLPRAAGTAFTVVAHTIVKCAIRDVTITTTIRLFTSIVGVLIESGWGSRPLVPFWLKRERATPGILSFSPFHVLQVWLAYHQNGLVLQEMRFVSARILTASRGEFDRPRGCTESSCMVYDTSHR